ncbi:hypothetical protein OZL92_08565 [Bacillus sonorensis]|uniref:Membrane bound lipoprotein n=2 Tax=Bacillus sonorensis TaxID=119858 RepID=M5P1S4_9BACI|nr:MULTISPECIES: hypothetical protein [Bacillus]TWK80557.1 Membrane-bound protein LytA [Bacillus paralicheniformis]ASB87151.1 Membrane-bound protein LytA [Bacillus sonorensis]EME73369.1 membrane bound lipoprotein [Bacillus sonorensis L12]MBG9914355.1 membrane protein [Bacillus sonorensis]MCF7616399.1 hypothetical protein [Bacillus sonorensis]
MKKFAALMFFMLLLAGCGTAEQSKQGEQTNQTDQTNEVQTEDGTFVGLADSHTIEVKINNEPVSLNIVGDYDGDIDQLKDGQKVKVTYKKTEKGQLELKEIKSAK